MRLRLYPKKAIAEEWACLFAWGLLSKRYLFQWQPLKFIALTATQQYILTIVP